MGNLSGAHWDIINEHMIRCDLIGPGGDAAQLMLNFSAVINISADKKQSRKCYTLVSGFHPANAAICKGLSITEYVCVW